MSNQSTKERKAKLRADIKLKYHNGSAYGKEFDGYCRVEMPNKDNKILKYSPGNNSLKVPFIVYADLECLPEKMHLYN